MQGSEARRIEEMFAAAAHQHRSGKLKEAERIYMQILRAQPRHADTLHLLGVLSFQLGRNDAAADFIANAIAENDRVSSFHNNLGNVLRALGRLEQAEKSYEKALALKQDSVDALYNLALTQQDRGKLDEAATAYGRVIARKPDHEAAHSNLGNILHVQGELDGAAACYERALRSRPDFLPAHLNQGNVLKAQGKLDEAILSYRRVLALAPDYAEAHNNLGIVLMGAGKLDEAVESYRRALSLKPGYAESYRNLGNALKEQGKMHEAADCYRRALSIEPNDAETRLGLAMAAIPIIAASVAESMNTGQAFARSLDELWQWNKDQPGRLGKSVGSNQPFYLAYRPSNLTAVLSRYGDLLSAAAAEYRPGLLHSRQASLLPRDRIRMVIVCAQIRQHHPVWEILLRGIIAHMKRAQFEIILYHTGSIVDDETVWARSRVDRFVQGPRPTAAWLKDFNQDLPDVIFYPEIGMDPATGALAASRLAPLQIASWGHPVTTGLPSIDLYFSAELLEHSHADEHYCEKLVRLPGSGVCTELPSISVQRWEGAPKPNGVVRYALCHQPIKFDPADDILLARIAKTVGPCEFWLASPTKLYWATPRLQDRLAAAFRGEGLDPDAHLRVIPWLRREQFLGFLDEMDVYLDCPAFSGYTTAWQAVHRGIPIVTLEGEFLRQRLAAGLMRQIGIVEGIASSRDEYVDLGVRFGRECLNIEGRTARRDAIKRAAPRADGNLSVIAAFERAVIEAARVNASTRAS
jgi:protein O-GlcNAc transferase